MKICIVSHDYPPHIEGRGYAIKRVTDKLAEKKIEVHIVTRMQRENLIDSLAIPSIREGNVYVHRIMHPSFGKLEHNPEEIYKVIFLIKKLDKEYNFDIFHGIGMFPCGFIAVHCAKELKKKSIVSGRGGDINIDTLKKENFAVVKWTLENTDKLIFVARNLLNNANKVYDCSKKSVIIYNSIDHSSFLYSKKINLPLSELNIGTIGIMKKIKGFDYLELAFRRLLEERKAKLFIIGFFEDDYTPFDKDIFVTGYVDQEYILNYIYKMDIIVIPSLSEGCPNSLLEAMYCKKAIIGTKVGAIEEIIENGQNGILVEPFSSEEIYQNLRKLADNPQLRKKMGDEAYKKIKDNFMIDTEIEKLIDVYNSLQE